MIYHMTQIYHWVYISKDLNTLLQRSVFIAALFTIGRKQNKMQYIYSIEFYSAVKENETVGK